MRWHRLCGSRRAVPLRCLVVRSWWNAELGKGANQLTAAPKPSGDQQRLPKAALAWARVDDRAAGRTRIEILADPPELLAWLRGNAGHGVDDRVPRTEGSRRRRGAQAGGARPGGGRPPQRAGKNKFVFPGRRAAPGPPPPPPPPGGRAGAAP